MSKKHPETKLTFQKTNSRVRHPGIRGRRKIIQKAEEKDKEKDTEIKGKEKPWRTDGRVLFIEEKYIRL